MTSTDHDEIDSDGCFQDFRSRVSAGLVRIPAVRHPTHGDLYIIWSDIRHCFPGVMRIQFDNIYVPMLRDDKTLLRYFLHFPVFGLYPYFLLYFVCGKKETVACLLQRG
jgi:hypothetical protein